MDSQQSSQYSGLPPTRPKPAAEYELYKRLSLLGEGSFGKAYLVEGLSDGKKWVIKQISMDAMSPEEQQEAVKEARILQQLNHPNIVKFKEIYKTKSGKLCIVMEYADGRDLADRIVKQRGKQFPEEQILDWFTQICLALKHVHDRKILHRDLKGQNIFLTASNTCKLGDFGIARVLNKTFEKAKTMVGTPYYLSPEIINGIPYSFKSDVWSLGIVLYEMCTLRPPFSGANLNSLALGIVKGEYQPIPKNYSSDLKRLVTNLLSTRPEQRYQIKDILALPYIRNRIKNFLSETINRNEFSHTILHNQRIIIDQDPDNLRNVGGAPPPSVAYQLQEQRKAIEKNEQKQLPQQQQINRQQQQQPYGQQQQQFNQNNPNNQPFSPPSFPQQNNSNVLPQIPGKQKPPIVNVRPQGQVNNNNARPITSGGRVGISNNIAEQQPKKRNSCQEIPSQNQVRNGGSDNQIPVEKENSSKQRQLSREPIKNSNNNGVQRQQQQQQPNNLKPKPQQIISKPNPQTQLKPAAGIQPKGMRASPSAQQIQQKPAAKPVSKQLAPGYSRPTTSASNNSKPVVRVMPSSRLNNVKNPSTKINNQNNNNPISRPQTAASKQPQQQQQQQLIRGINRQNSGQVKPSEAAQRRMDHLKQISEREEQRQRELDELQRQKQLARIESEKDRERKRLQMKQDLEMKRSLKPQKQPDVKNINVPQKIQENDDDAGIKIEWMGSLKPGQPPERPNYIENQYEMQRQAAEKYNAEAAAIRQNQRQREELERQRLQREAQNEEKQREKEKKEREMFLKKELHNNNDYENKPITAGIKQTYAVPDETEEMTKMFMEMKSILEDAPAGDSNQEEQVQNFTGYPCTERDEDLDYMEEHFQGSDKIPSNNNPSGLLNTREGIAQLKEDFARIFGQQEFAKLYKAILAEMQRGDYHKLGVQDQVKTIKRIVPSVDAGRLENRMPLLINLIIKENNNKY